MSFVGHVRWPSAWTVSCFTELSMSGSVCREQEPCFSAAGPSMRRSIQDVGVLVAIQKFVATVVMAMPARCQPRRQSALWLSWG
mmetsp:Transcript_125238/g.297224  ORF Transcript_125238/g.297224 Transcript_125238/m.297224 type:complete len:84 (-) Transcript_125238:580-831(-)